jgi:FG-GAP repeat
VPVWSCSSPRCWGAGWSHRGPHRRAPGAGRHRTTARAPVVGSEVVGGLAEQGTSVALSGDGDTALIGGPADASETGATWVFTRSGSSWTQQGKKLVGTETVGEKGGQGQSVALSADGATALIGGPGDHGAIGAAWVFTRSGSSWTQQQKLVGEDPSTGPEQGHSVSLSDSGDTALIGGPDDNTSLGAAWLFTRSGSVWSEQGAKLVGTGSVPFSSQGWDVALSGDGATALIGAPADNGGVGATWVFALPGAGEGEPAPPPAEKPGGETVGKPNEPGPKSAGPPSVFVASASPRCTLAASSSVVLPAAAKRASLVSLARHPAKPNPNLGALVLSASCDQAVTATVSGKAVEAVGRKPKHGRQRTKTYALGAAVASLAPGVGSTVRLKLAAALLKALAGHQKLSVTVTLVARDANGVATAMAAVKSVR